MLIDPTTEQKQCEKALITYVNSQVSGKLGYRHTLIERFARCSLYSDSMGASKSTHIASSLY